METLCSARDSQCLSPRVRLSVLHARINQPLTLKKRGRIRLLPLVPSPSSLFSPSRSLLSSLRRGESGGVSLSRACLQGWRTEGSRKEKGKGKCAEFSFSFCPTALLPPPLTAKGGREQQLPPSVTAFLVYHHSNTQLIRRPRRRRSLSLLHLCTRAYYSKVQCKQRRTEKRRKATHVCTKNVVHCVVTYGEAVCTFWGGVSRKSRRVF